MQIRKNRIDESVHRERKIMEYDTREVVHGKKIARRKNHFPFNLLSFKSDAKNIAITSMIATSKIR